MSVGTNELFLQSGSCAIEEVLVVPFFWGGKTRRAFVISYARSTSSSTAVSIVADALRSIWKSGPTSMIPSTPRPGRPSAGRDLLVAIVPLIMSSDQASTQLEADVR